MIRSVLCYNDPRLRAKAKPILEITDRERELAQDLIDTMRARHGVGLAATQIGEMVRMYVICDEIVNAEGETQLAPPEVLINPKLSHPSPKAERASEGCLSLPGLYLEVSRPESIQIVYHTLEGKVVEERPRGFRARVMMHENDHLNGVLIIDRVDSKERKRIAPLLRAMCSA